MPNTTNFNFPTPADTDLVKDGALAIRNLGNSIDTAFLDLKGGTSGQVLSKNSNTDLDFAWVAQDDSNAIQNAIIDAKGDLIVGTAADTPARLAVGNTNGMVLTVDSAEASGMKWVAPAAGGKVLQVVQATNTTATTIASTSYTDTGLTASITPSSTSSKILIMTNQVVQYSRSGNQLYLEGQLLRGATVIQDKKVYNFIASSNLTSFERQTQFTLLYLDSPSTTSSTTYKTQGRIQTTADGGTSTYQPSSAPSVMILMEIGA